MDLRLGRRWVDFCPKDQESEQLYITLSYRKLRNPFGILRKNDSSTQNSVLNKIITACDERPKTFQIFDVLKSLPLYTLFWEDTGRCPQPKEKGDQESEITRQGNQHKSEVARTPRLTWQGDLMKAAHQAWRTADLDWSRELSLGVTLRWWAW